MSTQELTPPSIRNSDDSFPIQSLMDLYHRNGELLESEKMTILNILILLLIFSMGCLIGSIILAPLFGLMKSSNSSIFPHHKGMNYEFVSQKLFENMRFWNSKLNQDHSLFSGTSPDRDEEQLVHLERNIEKLEGEDIGNHHRTRVPEFREKLPKSTVLFKYFISNGRPVKFSGSKVLSKSEWKCFKSGWHYKFIENLKKHEFFIVTQKPLHGNQIKSQIRYNIFPLLGQMLEEFPFKNHSESDVSEQSQIRDEVVANINKIKNEKYGDSAETVYVDEFENIHSNQAIIDDLVTGSGFQVENALQNPNLSFNWKKSTWNNQMNHYDNYEKLRSNHKPGGFMIPYQKIFINSYNKNEKLDKWLTNSLPTPPSFFKDILHIRSIYMRLSYSDDYLLNNFVLPIYQTNKESVYIQIKGKTKFILFDPLHSDSMKPLLSTIDWKLENDWKDGQTLISSVDPFNIVENLNSQNSNSFLKNSIAISVEIRQHEVLYVPAFWWVLELGIHEENFNLLLREEFDPHHSMYEAMFNGMLKNSPISTIKRPVKLPDLQ